MSLKTKAAEILGKVAKKVVEEQPIILAGAAIVGVVTTAVVACKDTTKATKVIKKAEEAKGEELTKTEKVKVGAKCYIRTGLVATSTIIAIIFGYRAGVRKAAIANAALSLAEKTYEETVQRYDEKIEKLVGKEKANDIHKDIKDQVQHTTIQTLPSDIEFYIRDNGTVTKMSLTELELALKDFQHSIDTYSPEVTTINEMRDYIGLRSVPNNHCGGDGWRSAHEFMYWLDPKIEDHKVVIDLMYNTTASKYRM